MAKISVGGIISVWKPDNPELMGKTIAFNQFVETLDGGTFEVGGIKIKEVNTLKFID
ncbi:MAG: hypothetical protein P8H05_01475 [Schleiferiaceae bacterium]|nr:hypothetical protein [Schleiferiaceae bacterium]